MGLKWDPFRDLVTFQEHINRLFDASVSQHRHEGGLAGWHPPADVCESEASIHLYIEIAGMEPDRFDIKAEGNRLTISGERSRPRRPEENYHQSEILQGPFHRAFVLPSDVDPNGIQAVYTQGMLEITLPKIKKSVTQAVPIKVK
ncbi:MAG TPA: Hsp20/alpha crystallin family protein [bacterium]|nr:Hsp20/alpha crystallin family protein [bacterium]